MPDRYVLKLSVPRDRQDRILRHPLLRAAGSRAREQLVGICYDTPRLELRRAGILLGLRKSAGGWVQTVRRQASTGAGLSRRAEWESPYGGHFDFAGMDGGALHHGPARRKLIARLLPVFETSFLRITWLLQAAPEVAILVMLDRGWIAAAGRRETISELELELLAGDSSDLYALAGQLAARVALVPELAPKAERGYALYLNAPRAPVKAGEVAIPPRARPLQALGLIGLDCLTHLQRNHAGAVSSEDPEYVHQMRVATRRLRAALRLFAPLLPRQLADDLLPPLRRLMQPLALVRDLDVLMMQIVTPVAAALPGEPRLADLAGIIAERLYRARREASLALRQPEYGRLLLTAGALFNRLAAEGAAGGGDEPALPAFAHRRLRKLRRRALELAKAARSEDAAALHALRIAIKRLRYALEFFAALLARRRVHASLTLLAELQDVLGQLNDLASAGPVLIACAGQDADLRTAVTLIGRWHVSHHARLLTAVPAGLARLARKKLPR